MVYIRKNCSLTPFVVPFVVTPFVAIFLFCADPYFVNNISRWRKIKSNAVTDIGNCFVTKLMIIYCMRYVIRSIMNGCWGMIALRMKLNINYNVG